MLSENGSTVLDSCRPSGNDARYVVTAYVGNGGQVLAAGASTGDMEAAESIDCVADAVRGWAMPDPGSYPAKVRFFVE